MIYAGGFIGGLFALVICLSYLGEALSLGVYAIREKLGIEPEKIPVPACDLKVCVARERQARGENWL